MSKKVRKFRPDDYWRIGEHESWFSDMALEGLHLKKIGARIATFEKGEPKKTRYRIDIYQGEDINIEQKQFYAESGWDFLTDYDKFNIYLSPVELNAPELHTDTLEQSYTLKILENAMSRVTFLTVISPIVLFFLIYFSAFINSTLILALLRNAIIQAFMFLVIGLRGIYDNIRSILAIKKLKKDLLEGIPIDHNAEWRNRNTRSKIVSYTLLGLSLIAFILPLLSISKYENGILPIISPNLPIVRLADVEQNSDLILNEENPGEWYYNWNIIAPIHYNSFEEGKVPYKEWDKDISIQNWQDNNGVYNPYIVTDTYKLAIPKMSLEVYNSFIKQAKEYSDIEFTEIINPKFEKLAILQRDAFIEVIGYKGAGVIKVRYFGLADVDNIIEAIGNKMNMISD